MRALLVLILSLLYEEMLSVKTDLQPVSATFHLVEWAIALHGMYESIFQLK
jgi:hypothetical protein